MEKKRSVDQYQEGQTQAALTALNELEPELQDYHDDIVLIGGLATYILTKGFFKHCGSEDVDFAVKTKIPSKGAKTISEIIARLGYEITDKQFPFRWSRIAVDNEEYTVNIDFMSGLSVSFDFNKQDYRTYFPAVQEGLRTMPIRSNLNFAFDFNFKKGSGHSKSKSPPKSSCLRSIDLVGSIVLKAARGEAKDYYDIFTLTYCSGGPQQAAETFNQLISHKEVSAENRELLERTVQSLSRRFKNGWSSGASYVHEFDKKQKKDDVASQVTAFLESVSQYLEFVFESQ
jgi:predicted nucleotidyltransferase component of viral defense system